MGFHGITSYPLSRVQFRYRSTERLHDLPRLNIELVVEVELKYKTLILRSVQYKVMDAFLVIIKGSLTTKSIVTLCHLLFHLPSPPFSSPSLPLFSLPLLSCTHSIGCFDNFSITYTHTSHTFLKTSFYSLE